MILEAETMEKIMQFYDAMCASDFPFLHLCVLLSATIFMGPVAQL